MARYKLRTSKRIQGEKEMDALGIFNKRRPLGMAAMSAVLIATGSISPFGVAGAQAPGFADPAFRRVWERTDLPLSQGRANRTWMWGPAPGRSLQEPFRESPN